MYKSGASKLFIGIVVSKAKSAVISVILFPYIISLLWKPNELLAVSNTKSSNLILLTPRVIMEPSVGINPTPWSPTKSIYWEITKTPVPVPNGTKLDCIDEVKNPSDQLASLCINFPASNESVKHILYKLSKVPEGHSTVTSMVSGTVAAEDSIITTWLTVVESFWKVNVPLVKTSPVVVSTPLYEAVIVYPTTPVAPSVSISSPSSVTMSCEVDSVIIFWGPSKGISYLTTTVPSCSSKSTQ